MLCLCDVMFSANVIINLNTLPSSVRPVSSLHVNILPTYINLLEGTSHTVSLVKIEVYWSLSLCCNLVYPGFDDQLLKLMVVQRSSLGVAVEDVVQKQQQNVKVSSSLSEILSMVCAYNLIVISQ